MALPSMHKSLKSQVLFGGFLNRMLVHSLILLLCSNVIYSKSTIKSPNSRVKSLPGFAGHLPFVMETGYIGVGNLSEVQLFYYFVESERSPKDDPVVAWITGGPGCSGLSGLVYEVGPLSFDHEKSTESKPVLELNPYSWTKVANIIFLDVPTGAGFSYATTLEAYNVSDTILAQQTNEFLRKWMMDHRKFLTNSLYIAGDSYSGITIPLIVQEIAKGNGLGNQPQLNLKGYALGNPITDFKIDAASRFPFAHLKGLISDKTYESFEKYCRGVFQFQTNALCSQDIQTINNCIGKLNPTHILEPLCLALSVKPMTIDRDPSIIVEDFTDSLLSRAQIPEPWCREYEDIYSYVWANNKSVQDALHVQPGTIKDWRRCNRSMPYTMNVKSTIDYHRNLITKGYRALIYSGDQDLVVPYVGTKEWIDSLNLTIALDWQPWFVEGQVAGYSVEYNNLDRLFSLTFATVKGGGHTVPEYKPKESLAMITRWIASYPL